MLKNPRLVFVDTSYPITAYSERPANRDLTERDFKKWYNNVSRRMIRQGDYYTDLLAVYDDEDGEHELANYWGNVEMSKNPRFPFF